MGNRLTNKAAQRTGRLMDRLGETTQATYTPAGGSGRTIDFIVEAGSREDQHDHRAELEYKALNVFVSAVNNTDGVVEPKAYHFDNDHDQATVGDEMTFEDKTWYVRKVLDRAIGGYHRLRLTDTLVPMIEDF